MPIDNPFFWLELKRHRRRRSVVAFRLLTGVGAGALWLLGVVLAGVWFDWWERVPLRPALFSFHGFMLFHGVVCMAAGGYAGDLVIGRDVSNHTLTALQLLPQPPVRFLVRKLAFPLWTVGVIWAAAIPLVVIAALLDLTTVSMALRGLLIAGWAGLAALLVTLLGTSGQLAPALDPLEKRTRGKESTCRGFLVIGAAGLALALAYYGWSTPERWPFFGLRIRPWLPGCLLTVVLVLATISHGQKLLLGELSSYRRSLLLAVAGLTVVYLLALGAFWSGLPLWGRWLTVIGPLALALLDHWQLRQFLRAAAAPQMAISLRKEDPWTASELRWLQVRWNNPLLLRDLRASLRSQSLRRRLKYALIVQPLLLVFFYFLVKWAGGAVLSGASSWFVIPLFAGGGAAAAFWGKEKKSGALPLLLLTALSSREILLGRLAASVLLLLPGLILPSLVVVGAGVWVATTRFWVVGPVVLTMLPLVLAAWISGGCRNTTSPEKVDGFQSSAIFPLVQSGAVLLVPLGGAVVVLSRQFGPWVSWGLALLISSLQLGFAVFVFRECERKLEAYRRSDIDPAAI